MVVLAYVICAIVWSTTWYAIRGSIGPGGFPTFTAAALRFTLASAVLAPVVLAGWAKPAPRTLRQIGWIALAGFFCSINYALLYLAEEKISGGLAAVLFGTMPLMTSLVAAATRTEPLARETVIGALVGLAGIAVISWDRLEVSAGQALSVVLVLAAVIAGATYTVVMKRAASELHPLASSAVLLPACGLSMWFFRMMFERAPLPWPPPLRPALFTAYLGLAGSVVAFACFFYLMRHVRLTTLMTLVFVEPVFALLIDAWLETEVRLGTHSYLGVAITLAGVLASIGLRPKAPPAPPLAQA